MVIVRCPLHLPVAVVATLVNRVVASLTEDDTVGERIRATKLCMTDVMSMGGLAESMPIAAFFAKLPNPLATRAAPVPLTGKGQSLDE